MRYFEMQRSKKELDEPLKPIDYKDGHVYLYEVDGNPGFVKLGYTMRAIQERSREWKFGCNRIPTVLFPVSFATAELVPMAHRVEHLCIAELKYRNVRATLTHAGRFTRSDSALLLLKGLPSFRNGPSGSRRIRTRC
jgi:hypothetical protein